MTEINNELFELAVAAEQRRARRTRLVGFLLASALVTPAGYVIAGLRGLQGRSQQLAAVLVAMAMVAAGLLVVRLIQWVSGQVVMGFVQPGGRSRSTGSHSKAQALAASGRLDEAATAFAESRASGGSAIASLRAEAELNASGGGDAKRAADLFLQIRRMPEATRSDELYASHRLIDLYIGILDDPGRVMVELRRMADRFPDTIDGQSALAELQRRRDEAQEER